MRILGNSSIIEGVFIKESKNRFLCEVEIDGRISECYVPSSCHLGNFLDLKGKTVLLLKNSNPNARTEYAIYAMPFKRSYIILNPSIANKVIKDCIRNRRFAFLGKRKQILSEHKVNGYKSDLYIQDTKTLIEIKSLISLNKEATFPTLYSERSMKQLYTIENMLVAGEKICYFIVSLNPYVDKVVIKKDTEFYEKMICCVKKGLCLKAYAIKFAGGKLSVSKEIQVDIT